MEEDIKSKWADSAQVITEVELLAISTGDFPTDATVTIIDSPSLIVHHPDGRIEIHRSPDAFIVEKEEC